MTETELYPNRRSYGMIAFWGLHSLMLAVTLLLEAAGLHFPVGSSLFYFTWIAIWMTHGLSIWLIQRRDNEAAQGDPTANGRFWRRLILGAHTSLYVAFGPIIILWWLLVRPPGSLQPGEGQGFWIYPVWLMLLLLHSGYVMMQERRVVRKPKRKMPSLKRLMEVEGDGFETWDDDRTYQKRKR